MGSVSRFENRHVQIREKVETLIFDLRYLVQLLEANIEAEEEHTGVADPGDSNYPVLARKHRARRDNLIAAISQLEGPLAQTIQWACLGLFIWSLEVLARSIEHAVVGSGNR
jgi:hypothetical protein